MLTQGLLETFVEGFRLRARLEGLIKGYGEYDEPIRASGCQRDDVVPQQLGA